MAESLGNMQSLPKTISRELINYSMFFQKTGYRFQNSWMFGKVMRIFPNHSDIRM